MEHDTKNTKIQAVQYHNKKIDLPAPKNGNAYWKMEAVKIVVQLAAPGTSIRKDIIQKMADKKYISSTKTFYKFLRRVEKGDLVTDGPWQQKKGRPKKILMEIRLHSNIQCH